MIHMLSNKDSEILQFLLHANKTLPLHEIADKFKLSERSIRYYIQNINYELPDAIRIVKRNCYIENHQRVIDYMNSQQTLQYTSQMKQCILWYHLIFDGYINLTTFSTSIDISRSSVKTYIEDIKEQLLVCNLTLQQEHKKGLILQGEEAQIRKLQLQSMLEYDRLSKTNQRVLKPILDEYLHAIDQFAIDTFLEQVQNELSFVLSDISYDMMHHYCAIMIHRLQHHHPITSCDNEYFLITCDEFNAVQKHYKLLLAPREDHYETLHLSSLLIGSHYAKTTDIRENNWFEHDLLVAKIISLYSHYYGVNLNSDRALYDSLLTHLRPTMYRLMNQTPVSDVDYHEIKLMFPKEYEIMHKVLSELNFFTNEQQDRNEIALLTLHFKAALQRCLKVDQVKKNILIVCSHGYGTSRLLEQQLLDTYEIEILDCIPFHSLKQYQQVDSIDIIITTILDLQQYENIVTIQVHPILTTEDIEKLDHQLQTKRKQTVRMSYVLDAIKKSCTIHELQDLKNDLHVAIGSQILLDDVSNKTLLDIMPLENIYLNYEASCWQDAIQLAGDLLVEHGYVSGEYRSQMQHSFENYGSYMMIDDGIAIPHAKNEGSVFKTGMTLVTLKEPVIFSNGKKIQVFFSFCSKDSIEHLDALMAIANLIKETEFKSKLTDFTSALEVLQYLIQQKI